MGRPKAWLPFGDEVLLQRVVRRMAELARPVVVVAADGQELPALGDYVTVARDEVEGRGPLQGLAAGLAALPEASEVVFVASTDAPFVERAWIEGLVGLMGDHDLAIPFVDGFLHPLSAVYRRSPALGAIRQQLRDGRLRVSDLAEVLRTRRVTADELIALDPGLDSLRNLNTPEEHQRALRDAGLASPAGEAG